MRSISSASIIAITAALLFATTARPAETTPPDQLVKTTSEEVLQVIKQNPDRNQLVKVAEAKVVPHFDFERMTRLAVGRSWNQANPDQRQRLQKEFRDLLVRTYTNAMAIDRRQDVRVDVKPVRDQKGGEVTVDTQINRSGGPPIPVSYRMEQKPDGWKVYDVVVEGVSLVTNYRDSFQHEVQRGGIDGLIKTLTDKNQSLAAGKGDKK
jgi:phospholipid transport system substrate-binding protein